MSEEHTNSSTDGADAEPAAILRALDGCLEQLWEEAQRSDSRQDRAEEHLTVALRHARRLIACRDLAADGAFQEELSEALDRLEERARDLFRDATGESLTSSRCLASLRASVRVYRRISHVAGGEGERDDIPFLLSELQHIENGLDLWKGAAEGEEHESPSGERDAPLRDREAVRDDLRALRGHLLSHAARARLQAAERLRLREDCDLPVILQMSHALESSALELSRHDHPAGGDPVQQLLVEVDRVREQLDRQFLEAAARLPAADRVAALHEASLFLAEELDEARITGPERPSPREVQHCDRLVAEGQAFLHAVTQARTEYLQDAAPGVDDPLPRQSRRTYRRVRKQVRRLTHFANDRALTLRLHGLFGARLTRAWEALVFWLIMLVLLLLVVDHYREPDPEGVIGWTDWVDTGICALLLWDFFVRLWLSRSRWSFLRRNALTDLLPSLPFALLANLEHIQALRSARVLRLVRVFRVLRVIRPVLRMGRLVLFLARAADRLVERNAWFLNRNIIFYAEDGKQQRSDPGADRRVRDLDAWIQRSTLRILEDLRFEAQTESGRWTAAFLARELAFGNLVAEDVVAHRSRVASDLDVEDVIQFLRKLDPAQVAELVGIEFSQNFVASTRFLRLPLLRRLGVVRFVFGPAGTPDPLLATARTGNVLGDALERVRRSVNWFADLYGTVTGAQFLDRFGMQLVMATARPAKRMILFGIIVGLIFLMVRLTRLDFLNDIANAMLKFLSMPVLILGGICLVPLLLGTWFRKIAGQVADFYERVAEAQFLSLTESVKERHLVTHLEQLTRRVLLPERRLQQTADPESERRVTQEVREYAEMRLAGKSAAAPGPRPFNESLCNFMLLFYRDFQDGALFHRNDTKISNMLLGNLTLENIRQNRLHYHKKRLRRIERLHFGSSKGSLLGPHLWFNFITHSVSHHTARLILEYNQHCIPAGEVPVADATDRGLFESWLTRREKLSQARREGLILTQEELEGQAGTDGTLVYRTTKFNALHFLTVDAERDREILEGFGERVFTLLLEDRRNLIRDIFGTYPMGELPEEKRTVNPYEFYRRFCAGGRMFLLPLTAFWFLCRGVLLLVRRVRQVIRDVVRPHQRPLHVRSGHAGFDVARRKIHRMRRPVVMEAIRLRAAFDVEYLGLMLPGFDRLTVRDLVRDDLRLLNASEREWEEFRELRARRESQIRLLGRLFRTRMKPGQELPEFLLEQKPALRGREGEAIRAMITALVCDHCQMFTVLDSLRHLADLLQKTPRRRRPRLRAPVLRQRALRDQVLQLWPLIAGDKQDDLDLRHHFVRAALASSSEIAPRLATLQQHLPTDESPQDRIVAQLLTVAEQPSSWTEQITAVRTIQTLGMIDLAGYEQAIRELGQYPEKSAGQAAGHPDHPAALHPDPL